MTIGILRRLFQILSLLGALALVLALPRALAPAAAPQAGHDRVDSSASTPMVAQETRVSAPAPAQLVPTARAWRMALAALATTGVVVLPAALIALLAGSLAGSWAARTNARVLRSTLAVLGAVAVAVPVFLVARIAAALAGPMPDALLAAVGRADPAGWLSAFATPVPIACIVVLAMAVAPGIAEAVAAHVAAASSMPWMRSARAQGIARRRINGALLRPGLRIAVTALAGRALVLLLALACVVESVTGWPGLGHLLVASMALGATKVTSACLVVLVGSAALVRLLTGFAARRLDPRPQGDG